MKTAELRFLCRMDEPARIPAYKGSMLRGAMGNALRRTCCTMHRDDCTDCLVRTACPFPLLFLAEGTGPTARPPMYSVLPDDDERTTLAKGDAFAFTLRLYSRATEYAPYFVHAILRSGETGIGKRFDEGSGKFSLEGVLSGGIQIYDPALQKMDTPVVSEIRMPEWTPGKDDGPVGRLSVTFLTPCRHKKDNRFSDGLAFEDLVMLAVRRARSLSLLEGTSYRIEDFDGFIQAAKEVRTAYSGLAWKDWTRWSNRQQGAMQFGGIVGTIQYEGHAAPFLPFLEFGALCQLGKQTSFGLGRLRYEWSPE